MRIVLKKAEFKAVLNGALTFYTSRKPLLLGDLVEFKEHGTKRKIFGIVTYIMDSIFSFRPAENWEIPK